jgi:hypothetical protein
MFFLNNPMDGLRSIKHLYQFQKCQEVIGKIHIITVFRDFQTTFIQHIEGQQTIYPNNNFLTSLYYKCPFPLRGTISWKLRK